jgi:hypothetical protein
MASWESASALGTRRRLLPPGPRLRPTHDHQPSPRHHVPMTAPPLVGAIALPDSTLIRGRGRREPFPAGPLPDFGLYLGRPPDQQRRHPLRRREPWQPDWAANWIDWPTSAPHATTSWPLTSSNTPTCSPTPATASKSPATAAPAEPAPSSPAWPSSPAIPPPTHSPGPDTTTGPEQSRLQANDAGSAGSPPTPAEQPTGYRQLVRVSGRRWTCGT